MTLVQPTTTPKERTMDTFHTPRNMDAMAAAKAKGFVATSLWSSKPLAEGTFTLEGDLGGGFLVHPRLVSCPGFECDDTVTVDEVDGNNNPTELGFCSTCDR